MEWIFEKYLSEHKDDVKCLLMQSIIETLKLDSETSKLKDFCVVNNIYININLNDLYLYRPLSILILIISSLLLNRTK